MNNTEDKRPHRREMFADDLSTAETITTGQSEFPSKRKDGTVIIGKAYLNTNAVKFINIPVGTRFLLNGLYWRKISNSTAKCVTNKATWDIDPATFVFVSSDKKEGSL